MNNVRMQLGAQILSKNQLTFTSKKGDDNGNNFSNLRISIGLRCLPRKSRRARK